MANYCLIRKSRILNEERIVSSIIGVGKLDIYMQNNEIRPLSYTTHKD